MTPEKTSMDGAQRAEILQKMAKLCHQQGAYQLACKKFTQAGDKLKAMKSLLKSRDTEKIIFFAGTARQADIYVLAGNYLQSLDWHNDHEIMKSILQFYSKAKAYVKLAEFYEACAQVEIDEYRDYEKAGGALREAMKHLAKDVSSKGGSPENDDRVRQMQGRIDLVDRFAELRKMAKSDPDQMVSTCEKMLEMPDVETAVRVGDIFAQLVEHYAEVQNFQRAHDTVERMRQRGIDLTPYLDHALLVTIYNAVGAQVPEAAQSASAAGGQAGQIEEDDVGEEIEEED